MAHALGWGLLAAVLVFAGLVVAVSADPPDMPFDHRRPYGPYPSERGHMLNNIQCKLSQQGYIALDIVLPITADLLRTLHAGDTITIHYPLKLTYMPASSDVPADEGVSLHCGHLDMSREADRKLADAVRLVATTIRAAP